MLQSIHKALWHMKSEGTDISNQLLIVQPWTVPFMKEVLDSRAYIGIPFHLLRVEILPGFIRYGNMDAVIHEMIGSIHGE